MFRKLMLASGFACLLATGAFSAEVYINVRPPHPVYERRVVRPGPEYVWTPGYHRWDGRAYAWTPGVWVVPPHHHAHWVSAHYVHRPGGWVFVEGHWR